jgi:hypothetical protein
VGTEVYRLSRNGEDLDRWVMIHNSTGAVYEQYFGNEQVALAASNIYDKMVFGHSEMPRERWPQSISNTLSEWIDREIGFDRKRHCPDEKMRNGMCESCPFLNREEGEGGDERWMCLRRRDEVRAAEKLMHGGAGG